MAAWGLDMGWGGVGCSDYQGAQGNFGGSGYAHYRDCDDVKTYVKTFTFCTLIKLFKKWTKLVHLHKRNLSSNFILFYLFFCFLGLHLQHMEVPRLGVELELQLPAYTIATATPALSHICNLHHSSWQHWILNPQSEARDRTCILMDNGWVLNPLSPNGNSNINSIFNFLHVFLQ